MKQKMYAIYDSKANFYGTPIFLRNAGEALRAFIDEVNEEKTQLNKHPEDFTLFEIGEYDNETGGLSNYDANISLGNAVEFKQNKQISENVKMIK